MSVDQKARSRVQGDELAQTLFRNILPRTQDYTSLADEIITHAKQEHGWKFLEMQNHGTAILPFTEGNMEYRILKADDTIPTWAVKRLDWVKEKYSDNIKAVVMGHELVDPLADTEEIVMKAGRAVKIAVLAVFAVVAAIMIASVAVTAIAVLAVGAAIMAIPSALTLDPQLIVVLNDEKETWILCAEWRD